MQLLRRVKQNVRTILPKKTVGGKNLRRLKSELMLYCVGSSTVDGQTLAPLLRTRKRDTPEQHRELCCVNRDVTCLMAAHCGRCTSL